MAQLPAARVHAANTAQPQQRRLRRRAVTAQHIHIRVPVQGIAVAGEATR